MTPRSENRSDATPGIPGATDPALPDPLNAESEVLLAESMFLAAFGLLQLADIALKGASPVANDPTTSMQAMDQMEVILSALSKKAIPPRVQKRQVGGAQMILKVGHYSFDDVVGLAFDQVRRASFTSGQVTVLERMVEMTGASSG